MAPKNSKGLIIGALGLGGILLMTRKLKASEETPAESKAQNPLASPYDDLFKKLGSPDIPSSYLWALAKQESSLNPNATGPGGEIGLMQIAKITLKSYNERHPNNQLTPETLREPENNISVACWLIRRILSSFSANHPVSLKTDWNSSRFVGLVTQAYNAGESEKSGVGRAVKELEKSNTPTTHITHIATAKIAKNMGFNKWMPETARLNYIDRVVRDYFRKLNLSQNIS